jgi:hypothetical protein
LATVVVTVRIAVPAEVPVMFTGVVEPKLRVGRSCAPLGLKVTAAVSATLPVKPPAGVTVMREVFPFVPPAVTINGLPVTANPGAEVAVMFSSATNPLPPDGIVVRKAPRVTGKSADVAAPATYTLPELSRANPLAKSPPPKTIGRVGNFGLVPLPPR